VLMRRSTASDRDMTQAANKHPPRRFRLQFYLLALSLALLIPALGLGTVVAMGMVNAYRGAFEARLRDTARALALAMDREIGAYRVAMLTLSGSVALDGPEPMIGTFESEARRAAAALGTSLFLLDATSLQRIIDTEASAGEPVNPITTADYRTVVETGQPLVTDLIIGTVVAKPVIGVAVPVKRDGHIRFVLVARLAPSHVGELLQMEGPPGATFDAVMDTRGAVVGRSLEHERYVGRNAPDWLTRGMVGREAGFLRGRAIEGADIVLGFARLGSTAGWTVVTAEPFAAYAASWRRPLEVLALGGGLIIILGAILAVWLSRSLVRPITALAGDARTFAMDIGETTPLPQAPPSGVTEFEALRVGFIAADAALRRRAVAQREADERQILMMREVDHRAKNALAVALSLVRLAPRNVPPKVFASAVEGRVAAMARAHSLLAQGAWVGGDIRTIAESELAPYTERVHLSGPPAHLAAGAVQPMAMLLHELATNAVRHGALSVPEGRVSLTWEFDAEDGRLQLLWTESGGPPIPAPPVQRGFGSRLITQLVERQLGGELQSDWQVKGLRISLAFSVRKTVCSVG
jgi:two-component sensor histidine kinase